jgi:hypothetical protein
MRLCRAVHLALPILIVVGHACSASAQQSDVSVSPSLSLPTSPSTGALAGLGLTLAGSSGFAFRASGHVALKNTYAGISGSGTWLPPWGADIDAMFALSGRPFGTRNRSVATFAFIGVGTSATDTVDVRLLNKNWSYGLGTMLPLGSAVDLFAESRWRMLRFVLPTASPRPARSKEFRFGMSFHLPESNSRSRR